MKVIEINNCTECPYQSSLLQQEGYCGQLAEIIRGRLGLPELKKPIPNMPKEGVRNDCPLKDYLSEQQTTTDKDKSILFKSAIEAGVSEFIANEVRDNLKKEIFKIAPHINPNNLTRDQLEKKLEEIQKDSNFKLEIPNAYISIEYKKQKSWLEEREDEFIRRWNSDQEKLRFDFPKAAPDPKPGKLIKKVSFQKRVIDEFNDCYAYTIVNKKPIYQFEYTIIDIADLRSSSNA